MLKLLVRGYIRGLRVMRRFLTRIALLVRKHEVRVSSNPFETSFTAEVTLTRALLCSSDRAMVDHLIHVSRLASRSISIDAEVSNCSPDAITAECDYKCDEAVCAYIDLLWVKSQVVTIAHTARLLHAEMDALKGSEPWEVGLGSATLTRKEKRRRTGIATGTALLELLQHRRNATNCATEVQILKFCKDMGIMSPSEVAAVCSDRLIAAEELDIKSETGNHVS